MPRSDETQAQLHLAEASLEAANSASSTARTMYTGFMALTAYIVVTLGTTDDFQILHYSPITLPLLNVGIDLKGFYALVPWLYLLIHAYMLLVFSLLTQKLHHFEAGLATLPYPDRAHLRKRLHVLALTQYVSGRQSGLLGILISFMVWFTASVMPIALLLWIQLDFLPAQEPSVVWGQRGALLIDCLVGWYFWHRIMQGRRRQLMPRDWSPPWWRRPTLGGWMLGANALMMLWLGWFVALIPISPWERQLNAIFNEDCPSDISTIGWDEVRELLMDENLEAPELSVWASTMKYATEWKNGPRRCVFDSTHWLSDRFGAWFPRALSSTFGQAFSSGTLRPRSKESLLGSQAGERELDEIIGLDLSERSFRFANFAGSALPKATLRLAQFQGATLWEMNLQRSDMYLAQFHGADMSEAQLQESLLAGAQMQGVDLSRAQLRGAILAGAGLQGAYFSSADLRGADFSYARLQGAKFDDARMEATSFQQANMAGARLVNAGLAGALFREADIKGAMFSGTDLAHATFEGANADGALFKDASIYQTQLRFDSADLAAFSNIEEAKPELVSSVLQALESIWVHPILKLYAGNHDRQTLLRASIDRMSGAAVDDPNSPLSRYSVNSCIQHNTQVPAIVKECKSPGALDGGTHVERWPEMMLQFACANERHAKDIITGFVATANFLDESFRELTGRSYLGSFLGDLSEVPAMEHCGAPELIYNTAIPLLFDRFCAIPSFRDVRRHVSRHDAIDVSGGRWIDVRMAAVTTVMNNPYACTEEFVLGVAATFFFEQICSKKTRNIERLLSAFLQNTREKEAKSWLLEKISRLSEDQECVSRNEIAEWRSNNPG